MAKTLSINVEDIHSVTDFQRNAKSHVTRLRKTKTPMVLTVNGSAAVVVQDAKTFQASMQRLEDLEERQRFIAAINEALAESDAGLSQPIDEAFEEMRRELGIRR